jgi:uncharacterized protein (DUF58 family)
MTVSGSSMDARTRVVSARPVRGFAYAMLVARTAAEAVLRPVRRVVAPVVSTIAPFGWIALAAGIVSLVIAVWLGWSEFFYLAATLIAALLIAVPFTLGRSSYAVEIGLSPSRVVMGDNAHGSLVVSNTGATDLLPSQMELPVGPVVSEFAIPRLAPGASHEATFTVPTAYRAVITAGPAVSVRGDQLGLLRRAERWTEPIELFVHPRTTRLTTSAAGLIHDLEGQASKSISENDLSFHALRPYVPGDDRRNVHWRTSARMAGRDGTDGMSLMIRQFEETRRSQLTVLHGCFRDYYASDDEFELAVSIVGSVAAQVIRDGTQISVVTEDRMLRTHTVTAMLDDSCRLAQTPRLFASARDFGRKRTQSLPRPSIVMIVSGSLMTPTDYRSIANLFGAETRIIAFRIEVGSTPRLDYLSGLSVMTVGFLSDLPKLFKRAAS